MQFATVIRVCINILSTQKHYPIQQQNQLKNTIKCKLFNNDAHIKKKQHPNSQKYYNNITTTTSIIYVIREYNNDAMEQQAVKVRTKKRRNYLYQSN